jgi:threonine dehydrogenase-like Zn-dependent dehydrogenase
VYTLDLFDNRLELSKKYGSDYSYNLTNKNYTEALNELKEKFGQIDVVIDTIGMDLWKAGNVRNLALYLLKRHGLYIAWGHPTEDAMIDIRRISNEDIILRGFEPGIPKSNDLIKFGEELLSSQRINVTDMITNHITLEEVEKGLNLCKNDHDKVIKIVIDIVP